MDRRFSVLACLLFTVCGWAAAEFRAAIAIRDVTPEKLLPLSGGMGPGRPAKEKKGQLTVRALVLADDDTKIAICSTDFLGFPGALCNRVRAKVEGIPAKNILIGATHNHSGPDMYGFPDEQGKFTNTDLEYIEFVCDKLAQAINEAAGALRPVEIKIATGEAQGKIAYNYYAPQLYDPRCHVIQALDSQTHEPIATLVNYASHPEVLGPDAGILAPDFVGPLYDRIAELGGGVGIYMNSAQGGMVTADNRSPDGEGDMRTWDECLRIGHLLADEAIRIVTPAPVQADPDLYCAAKSVTFPVDSEEIRMVMKLSPVGLGGTETDSVTTTVNLVNLGNAQILTIPGEALPNIGYYLKRKMKGEHNFLFGLTNDAYGYMLTKVDWNSFKRYKYISATSLGEMTAEIYIEEALKFVDENPTPTPLAQ